MDTPGGKRNHHFLPWGWHPSCLFPWSLTIYLCSSYCSCRVFARILMCCSAVKAFSYSTKLYLPPCPGRKGPRTWVNLHVAGAEELRQTHEQWQLSYHLTHTPPTTSTETASIGAHNEPGVKCTLLHRGNRCVCRRVYLDCVGMYSACVWECQCSLTAVL